VRAILLRLAFEGTEPVSTELIDAAVVVLPAEELADGADTVDARLTRLALLAASACDIFRLGYAASVFTELLTAALVIGFAEGATLSATTIGSVGAFGVIDADVDSDTQAVLAALVFAVTVV